MLFNFNNVKVKKLVLGKVDVSVFINRNSNIII